MLVSLKGKKALVGGSSQGLGKAIAIQLAASGAEVTLMARNEEKLSQLLNELPKNQGQKHSFLLVDFSDLARFREVITNYFTNHTVDILVNNTQGPQMGGVLDNSPADYQTAFDLLFQTVTYISQQALPGMKVNGYGRIINLSSITVKEPLAHLVLSNTIRSAVLSWSKTLAKEVAAEGITVNSLLTGYFETERLQKIIETQSAKKGISYAQFATNMHADIPARRFGKPEEFGFLVAFLASDLAAYINGTSIPIDGGFLKSM